MRLRSPHAFPHGLAFVGLSMLAFAPVGSPFPVGKMLCLCAADSPSNTHMNPVGESAMRLVRIGKVDSKNCTAIQIRSSDRVPPAPIFDLNRATLPLLPTTLDAQ